MSPTLLFRIASVLLVLFAALHTFGFLKFAPASPGGQAVLRGMKEVPFSIAGTTRTYDELYRGFGLYNTAYLFFSAFLAWVLGGLAQAAPQAVRPLGWGLFVLQLVSVALSWIYFFVPPLAFSGLVAVCVGRATWRVGRS
jgi:hypothetical protein